MRATRALTAVLLSSGAIFVGVALSQGQQPSAPPTAALRAAAPRVEVPVPRPMGPRPRSAPSAPRPAGPARVASPPLAVAIPAINVQSSLLRLGLEADGSMAVPAPGPDYNRAGWYKYSPAPGSLGPAVIVGHVNSAADGPSVFFRLANLRPRDTVLVTRADGSVAVFAVDDVRRYPKSRFPTQLVYGNTDHAALRLITCGGPLDRDSGHYRDNVIVRASLVSISRPARAASGPEHSPAGASLQAQTPGGGV